MDLVGPKDANEHNWFAVTHSSQHRGEEPHCAEYYRLGQITYGVLRDRHTCYNKRTGWATVRSMMRDSVPEELR